jgi:hypothetical protein
MGEKVHKREFLNYNDCAHAVGAAVRRAQKKIRFVRERQEYFDVLGFIIPPYHGQSLKCGGYCTPPPDFIIFLMTFKVKK